VVIGHPWTTLRRRQTTGFAERFNRAVLDEIFRETMRGIPYESVEALQADIDALARPPRRRAPPSRRPQPGAQTARTIVQPARREG